VDTIAVGISKSICIICSSNFINACLHLCLPLVLHYKQQHNAIRVAVVTRLALAIRPVVVQQLAMVT
jgi:hypothetical protein